MTRPARRHAAPGHAPPRPLPPAAPCHRGLPASDRDWRAQCTRHARRRGSKGGAPAAPAKQSSTKPSPVRPRVERPSASRRAPAGRGAGPPGASSATRRGVVPVVPPAGGEVAARIAPRARPERGGVVGGEVAGGGERRSSATLRNAACAPASVCGRGRPRPSRQLRRRAQARLTASSMPVCSPEPAVGEHFRGVAGRSAPARAEPIGDTAPPPRQDREEPWKCPPRASGRLRERRRLGTR